MHWSVDDAAVRGPRKVSVSTVLPRVSFSGQRLTQRSVAHHERVRPFLVYISTSRVIHQVSRYSSYRLVAESLHSPFKIPQMATRKQGIWKTASLVNNTLNHT